jgi:DNA-binding response OmpR family regulator
MSEASPIVFVVDDDAGIRDSLKDLFASVGLEVQLFGSPQEFLSSMKPDRLSCLVLDVRLPGISGLDFQAELQKSNFLIPIIFITGHGDIPMSVRAIKAGATEFLTKPFRDQDLLDAVQRALDRDGDRRRQHLAKMSTRGKVGLRPAMKSLAAGVAGMVLLAAAFTYLQHRRVAHHSSSDSALATADKPPGRDRAQGHIEVPVQTALTSTTVNKFPDQGIRWYLSAIAADKIKLGDLGFSQVPGSAVVGVVDSGVDVTHPLIKPVLWHLPQELATNYWPSGSVGYDFHINHPDPTDDVASSHGTHVTGLVTGRQIAVWSSVFDEAGLAENVKAFSLKITAADGSFDFTAAQNAIEAGITNNIHIFNLSLFGPYSQMLQQDLERSERRNSTLFIAAAGNDATDLDVTADYHRTFRNEDGSGLANVIFVAALSDTGEIADFSNYGKSLVQIAAPGVVITSTVSNGKFAAMSGSSQAAPLVTFTAAILKAEQPDVVPLAIKNRILNTCDWDDKIKDKVANGCRLNLLKAVICHSDLVELRDGVLLRGDIDKRQFFKPLPTDNSLVRVRMTGSKDAIYVYSSGKQELNTLLVSSVGLKLHFGEVCPHEETDGLCHLNPSEIKDIIYRYK